MGLGEGEGRGQCPDSWQRGRSVSPRLGFWLEDSGWPAAALLSGGFCGRAGVWVVARGRLAPGLVSPPGQQQGL